jgi:hypothetical protein
VRWHATAHEGLVVEVLRARGWLPRVVSVRLPMVVHGGWAHSSPKQANCGHIFEARWLSEELRLVASMRLLWWAVACIGAFSIEPIFG